MTSVSFQIDIQNLVGIVKALVPFPISTISRLTVYQRIFVTSRLRQTEQAAQPSRQAIHLRGVSPMTLKRLGNARLRAHPSAMGFGQYLEGIRKANKPEPVVAVSRIVPRRCSL
jgi:hypothetical protein